VRLAAPTHLTLRAALLIAMGVLAACGSARKVADERPLCQRCHGGTSGNAAPPTSVSGATVTSDPKVGAHQAHVVAGRLRGPIACSECHVVPADMKAHEAGIAAIAAGTASRVSFGPLAAKDTTTAAWNSATAKCGSTYCHGATMNHGGTNQNPSWTAVDAGHTEAACGTCHFMKGAITTDFPVGHPSGDDNCVGCHPQTLVDNDTINVAGGRHMNGEIDGGCNGCHPAPPADRGHQVHAKVNAVLYGDTRITKDLSPASTNGYVFGCGNCHPLDIATHTTAHPNATTGTAIVELSRSAPRLPPGSLRARNHAAASYNSSAKTCSGVYCHSSGQATPAFAVSPPWNGPYPTAAERCGGCHGNPPNYTSGGAGTATANSHIGLIIDGGPTYETGHFGGFPAAFHAGSNHGVSATVDSSPITCQACHFDTVVAYPGIAGASGFYFLDTTGDYDLGGTGSFTLRGAARAAYACTVCHTGTPPAGQGGILPIPAATVEGVMPYFHVDGARDVVFDARTSLPGTVPGLPAAPNRPTRPFWFTGAPSWAVTAVGADGGLDGTTLSFSLKSADVWNSSAKSCTSVVCHFNRAMRPTIVWGEPLSSNLTSGTCTVCHDN
jgi:predicted CxxxxCH...CXXCH cytochrome family protein